MRKSSEDFSEQDEDTEIQNLPLYTERKADVIYRYRMKDKMRNTGCPEAISRAILGHSENSVAANYGTGYAFEVTRKHMEKAWY